MPEIIEDGVNGIMVDCIEDAVRAVKNIAKLSRVRCRRAFEKCFTVERMAREYIKVYQALIAKSPIAKLRTVSIAS